MRRSEESVIGFCDKSDLKAHLDDMLHDITLELMLSDISVVLCGYHNRVYSDWSDIAIVVQIFYCNLEECYVN